MRPEEISLKQDQQYNVCCVVGRFNKIGKYSSGVVTMPIHRYLTLDNGKEKFAVEFVDRAPTYRIEGDDHEYIDFEKLEKGQLLIDPGLIYKRIPWTSKLMNMHLIAMKSYTPKDIIIYDKPEENDVIDMGFKNFSSEKILAKDHEKRKNLKE